MQGTVKTYDEQSRNGVILDDTLGEHPFDAQSFAGSGLRMLRLGQRVRFNLDGTRVKDLNIITL